MKKAYIFLTLMGVIVSYIFTGMIMSGRIINPLEFIGNKPLVLSKEELLSSLKDFEVTSENSIKSTSEDPWIYISDIDSRVSDVKSVVYRFNKINAKKLPLTTEVYYAYKGETFSTLRRIETQISDNIVVIEMMDYIDTKRIDGLRLDLVTQKGIELEIKDISINTHIRFSVWLFMLIFVIYMLVIYTYYRE